MNTSRIEQQRSVLKDVFASAVEAAHPRQCLVPHLPPMPPEGRLVQVVRRPPGTVAHPPVPGGVEVEQLGHGAPRDVAK